MNTDAKPVSAVELLLDKINWMSGVINTLEYRICELERKVNHPQIQLSDVAYTGSHNDLLDAYGINNAYNTYNTTGTYYSQPERYVTDMQNQNGDLVIQFSDGTTAHINDEGL